MLSKKGFLGPIGDDLPSLVPLIFALIIFFSTFTYAMNSMDSRNEDFDADLATLSIARIMRSNGYITGIEDFKRLCDNINISGLNYEIALAETSLTYNKDNYAGTNCEGKETADVDVFDLCIFDSTPSIKDNEEDRKNSEFFCSNLAERPDLLQTGQAISSRTFPIVLEDAKIAKPMFLVVTTWRP